MRQLHIPLPLDAPVRTSHEWDGRRPGFRPPQGRTPSPLSLLHLHRPPSPCFSAVDDRGSSVLIFVTHPRLVLASSPLDFVPPARTSTHTSLRSPVSPRPHLISSRVARDYPPPSPAASTRPLLSRFRFRITQSIHSIAFVNPRDTRQLGRILFDTAHTH